MKNFVLFVFVALLTSTSGYGQINQNAITVNSYGDLRLKRHQSGDTNYKTALSVIGSGVNYTLNLNYGKQFAGGVKINGKTVGDELSIATDGLSSKYLGFVTHYTFTHNSNSYATYGMTLRPGNVLAVSGNGGLEFFTNSLLRMKISYNGNVGIGTANPDEKLTVKGKIHAEEVKVDLSVPADYVFQKYFTGTSELKPDYKMPTLNEVESFIQKNNHLPDIPSAKEIQENGLNIGEMNNLLLQKVEELILYIIEQDKRIEALEAKLADIE